MAGRVFDGLNYAFGNEDCSVEFELLPQRATHVATVCHSGAQLVPFLTRRPSAITFVDVSKEQLIIAELRYALLKTLNFEEWALFWGYDDSDGVSFRKSCIANLDFRYGDVASGWLSKANWQAPLYIGKWEQTASKLARLYRTILGNRGLRLFDCTSVEEQHDFLRNHFPRRRWNALVKTAASLAALYATLRPSQMPPGTKPRDFYPAYRRIFDAHLSSGLARDNFFFELLMWGKFKHGTPLEARRAQFDNAQQWVGKCDVRFVHSDVFTFLKNADTCFDFVTLSNVTSYVHKDTCLQLIKDALTDHARVVIRHFLVTAKPDAVGYFDETSEANSILEQECTRIYDLKVFRRTT